MFSQLKQLKQLLTISFVVFLIITEKTQRRRVFIGMNVALSKVNVGYLTARLKMNYFKYSIKR